VEAEATIVRLIYRLFLEGKTFSGIARHLTENHIPTPAGKKKWRPSTVKSILQNEKYKGDARLQKAFTVDFLTKKKKVNEGELPQFYVEGSHPAIISSQVFDLVQHEFKKRKNVKGYKTGSGCFSGKIICGECGGFYGSKVWHSTSKYRRTIWQCNHKFKNEKKCQTPHLYEDRIKEAFLEAFNSLLDNKDEILEGYKESIHVLTDTSGLDRESAKLLSECEVVAELLHKCVKENARSALDQQEYQQRYTSLAERYEAAKDGLRKIDDKRLERNAKCENIGVFIRMLEKSDTILTEFDEGLWITTVDAVVVHSEHEITFIFKDGLELDWKI